MSKRLRKKKSNLWVGFIHLVVIFVLVFGGYLLWKSTGNKGFDLQNYLSLDEWMSFSQDTLEQEDLGYAGLKGELAKSLVKMNLKMGKNFSFGKDVDGSVLLKVRVQQSQLDLTYMTLVLKKALRAQGSSILEASVLLENKENQIVARAKDGQIYTVSIGTSSTHSWRGHRPTSHPPTKKSSSSNPPASPDYRASQHHLRRQRGTLEKAIGSM